MKWCEVDEIGIREYLGLFRVSPDIITMRVPWGWLGVQYSGGVRMLYTSGRFGMKVLIGAKAKRMLRRAYATHGFGSR